MNVTVTATDAVGLTDVKMVVLTAKDTSPPTITCRPNIVLNACQPTATWTTPTASDNCSGVVVTQTGGSLSGSTFTNGTTTTISYKATDGGGNQATCSFTVTRANAMNLTVTNSNPQLYFGYSLDQSTVIKGVPTGGVPPYTMTITMNRPLSCNMVNSTGDEKWLTASGVSTGSICPSSGPGTVPLTSATLLAGGSNSVTATLLGNAVIIVTVTDANGCSISKSTNVYAEDARCFAGNSGNEKVKLCHRTGNTNEPCHELCVSENAVSAHLAHGDYIGGCLPNCATPPVYRGVQSLDFDVRAYPNPSLNDFTIVVDSKISSKIILNIYDMSSRLVKKIEGNYGKPIVFGDDLPTGIYYTVISQDDNQKTLKLIKQ